jgi:hypothetical protein
MNDPIAKHVANIKQAGKITFAGQLAVKFWIRALDLADEVKFAQDLMTQKSERKWGSVPIVAEYAVDDRLTFVFLIIVQVDALGVKDGTGIVMYASPDRLEEVKKYRDGFADDILKNISKDFDEVIEIPDKNERSRAD